MFMIDRYKVSENLLFLPRTDSDPVFEVAPGMRRAARDAAELLSSLGGHELVRFEPHQAEAAALYGRLISADDFKVERYNNNSK